MERSSKMDFTIFQLSTKTADQSSVATETPVATGPGRINFYLKQKWVTYQNLHFLFPIKHESFTNTAQKKIRN